MMATILCECQQECVGATVWHVERDERGVEVTQVCYDVIL